MKKILVKPIVTEKSNSIAEKLNSYTFEVAKKANKIQIKQAVESLYGVTVVSVNTARIPGKKRSRFTKGGVLEGYTNAYKKAVVTLNDGDTIDFYENV